MYKTTSNEGAKFYSFKQIQLKNHVNLAVSFYSFKQILHKNHVNLAVSNSLKCGSVDKR
jgi:hypothetical protein